MTGATTAERYREAAPGLVLDTAELRFSFIRAPGPGGQNVNKVATAVQCRFDVRNSPSLPAPVRARLERLAGTRLTTGGEIVIAAHATRSQAQNREAAIAQLLALIAAAAKPPRKRHKTAVPRAERTRRLEAKRQNAARKAARRAPQD
ncbi:MAG: aminoacyl-tRNA hydrolase [Rhodospirillales bacterium]|jgi:ribosome-associated protein|nr:aminoacyl-tRNA hydrolase [Rhodospirillales bacterium]